MIEDVVEMWNNALGHKAIDPEMIEDHHESFRKLSQNNPAFILKQSQVSAGYLRDLLSENPALYKAFSESAIKHGISPQLLATIITLENRGKVVFDVLLNYSNDGPRESHVGATVESVISILADSKDASVGPAQLGADAREAAQLTLREAMTWEGAFEGAANWLSSHPSIKQNQQKWSPIFHGQHDTDQYSLESYKAASYNGSYAYGVYHDLIRRHIWTEESF